MLHLPRSQCFVLAVPLDQRCDTFSKTLKTHGAFSFGLKLFYCLLWLRASRVPAPWNRKCVLNAFMCVFVPERQNYFESMHERIRVHAYFNVNACLYVKGNVCLYIQYVCIYASLVSDSTSEYSHVWCQINDKIYTWPWTTKPGSFFFIEIYISQSRINKLSIDWLVRIGQYLAEIQLSENL